MAIWSQASCFPSKTHPWCAARWGGDKILRERYDRPWYELYAGDKAVIVGHNNYTKTDQPFVYKDKVFGLDTDCVHGKPLTGLLLPAFRFISVPSRGNLWAQVRRTYQRPCANSQSNADSITVRSVFQFFFKVRNG